MDRTYIVLRSPERKAVRGSPDGGATLDQRADISSPAVEFGKMSRREAADMARAPGVEAVVPEIPLALVKPMMCSDADAAPLDDVAWGVRAVGALDCPWTGKGVKVAVLDTGIDARHAAFRGMDLIEVDYTGEGNGDENGHGTHCAATMFGREVRGVRVGVAPGITHAFIGKVIGKRGGGTSLLLKAIRDAVGAGCQILSMSLGFDFPGAAARLEQEGFPAELAHAIALADYRANVRLFDRLGEFVQAQAVSEARELLLLAAAGNESRRHIDTRFEMPAAPPGEAAGFTSVGALGRRPDGTLEVASFSNTGCHLAGPGVAIRSAKAGTATDLVAMSGTSMATPHVAGVAALFAEKERALPVSPSFFRARPTLLFRVLGGASLTGLAPGLVPGQVGLGMVRAPPP